MVAKQCSSSDNRAMQRRHQLELLDSNVINPADLYGNLRDLAWLNRFTGATAAILSTIERMLVKQPISKPLSIIDIGTGGGDLPTALTRWATCRHLPLVVFGADLHVGILDYARRHSMATGWLRADGTHLPLATGGVDIAVCTLMAHHLEPDLVTSLVTEMQRVSRIGFVVMDLERSRTAHAALWILTRLISRNPLTRNDGPLSIERAYTRAEVASLATSVGISLRLEPIIPFRWIATWQAR